MNSKVLLVALSLLSAVSVECRVCDFGNKPHANVTSATILVNGVECLEETCLLPRGSTALGRFNFDAKDPAKTMEVQAKAQVGGNLVVNYPITDGDQGCGMLTNTLCPVDQGESCSLEITFAIGNFPEISLVISILGVNEEGEELFCYAFPAQVVSA